MTGELPTERSFGVSVGCVSVAVSALVWWRGHPLASQVLFVVGSALVLFGLLAPSALYWPNRIWWRFAQALGWVNSRILLAAFFLLILTPSGFVLRLCGWHPLSSVGTSTNWRPYPASRRNLRHYEKLY